MSSEFAIEVSSLSKCYQIFDKPSDRLKQMLFGGRIKLYKEFWALRNISFQLKRGSSVAIIGRNGSGKSTLLQMICGTLSQTTGEIKVNGKVAALLELGAGFNPEFTGVENVFMAASLYGLTKEDVDRRFSSITAFADIGNHINQPVKTYSSGMYVRLAFAVIAHIDAEILVIDEALAVGDAVFTQKCMRFIDRFRQKGTIIFVSHDAAAVARVAEKALLLNAGDCLAYGPTADVLELYHQNSLKEISQFYSEIKEIPLTNDSVRASNNNSHFNQLNPQATTVGCGKVLLTGAVFLNTKGQPQNIFYGADDIKLIFTIRAKEKISGLLVGFTLKDRLGQKLIEENNSGCNRASRIDIKQGSSLRVVFEYKLPYLKSGKYFIDLAVAEGTQSCHESLLWVYDAIEIDSSPSIEVYGLISSGLKNFAMELSND